MSTDVCHTMKRWTTFDPLLTHKVVVDEGRRIEYFRRTEQM